ncbi:MAG: JAB domain-containing protein [Phycisphaerales bacterium]|nr:JAB domain-containing protein [Phycisphaerales bacterium]
MNQSNRELIELLIGKEKTEKLNEEAQKNNLPLIDYYFSEGKRLLTEDLSAKNIEYRNTKIYPRCLDPRNIASIVYNEHSNIKNADREGTSIIYVDHGYNLLHISELKNGKPIEILKKNDEIIKEIKDRNAKGIFVIYVANSSNQEVYHLSDEEKIAINKIEKEAQKINNKEALIDFFEFRGEKFRSNVHDEKSPIKYYAKHYIDASIYSSQQMQKPKEKRNILNKHNINYLSKLTGNEQAVLNYLEYNKHTKYPMLTLYNGDNAIFFKKYGFSEEEATKIMAIKEINLRYLEKKFINESITDNKTIKNYFDFLSIKYGYADKEYFSILFVKNEKVVAFEQMFVGNESSVRFDADLIQLEAQKHDATSIIMAHNHPSGGAIFSDKDDRALHDLSMKMAEIRVKVDNSVLIYDGRIKLATNEPIQYFKIPEGKITNALYEYYDSNQNNVMEESPEKYKKITPAEKINEVNTKILNALQEQSKLKQVFENNVFNNPVPKIGYPYNPVTEKYYTGIRNSVFIMLQTKVNQYNSMYVAGYEQWKELGGQVKKGSKGLSIFVPLIKTTENEENKTAGETKKVKESQFYGVMVKAVHNIANIEGLKEEVISKLFNPPRQGNEVPRYVIDNAEKIIESYKNKPKITFSDGTDNYYLPQKDSINLTNKEKFISLDHYYSTYFHELAHSVFADNRLGSKDFSLYINKVDARKGIEADKLKETYNFGEFVAELTASYLCHISGVDNRKFIEEKANYIYSWVRDNSLNIETFNKAVELASKAVDYIMNNEKYVQEQNQKLNQEKPINPMNESKIQYSNTPTDSILKQEWEHNKLEAQKIKNSVNMGQYLVSIGGEIKKDKSTAKCMAVNFKSDTYLVYANNSNLAYNVGNGKTLSAYDVWTRETGKTTTKDFIADFRSAEYLKADVSNFVAPETEKQKIDLSSYKIEELKLNGGYLVNERKINAKILEQFKDVVKQGNLKGEYENVPQPLFLFKNRKKDVTQIQMINTYAKEGKQKYFFGKGEKGESLFIKEGKNPQTVFITESPIDCLSHKNLYQCECTYIATGGNPSKEQLQHIIDIAKDCKHVILGHDNDVKGNEQATLIYKQLKPLNVSIERAVPNLKDWNDDLKNEVSKLKNQQITL